jgi:hypothetical protein
VREAYSDAYLTAHFEVPGEMFSLAMDARRKDMGVVGSTQNILDFITAKVGGAWRRLRQLVPLPSALRTGLVQRGSSQCSPAPPTWVASGGPPAAPPPLAPFPPVQHTGQPLPVQGP